MCWRLDYGVNDFLLALKHISYLLEYICPSLGEDESNTEATIWMSKTFIFSALMNVTAPRLQTLSRLIIECVGNVHSNYRPIFKIREWAGGTGSISAFPTSPS